MSSENLARLADGGKLKAEPPSRKDLSLESRFDLAYGAAYAFSLAALRWNGYRSENRYLVFQCLPHTLGLGPEHWRVLALCHERRNDAQYEGIFEVDEKLMAELLRATDVVRAKVDGLEPPK